MSQTDLLFSSFNNRIINNIDFEHTDFYNNLNHIKESFIRYAKNIPFWILLYVLMIKMLLISKKISSQKIISYGLSSSETFQQKILKHLLRKKLFSPHLI